MAVRADLHDDVLAALGDSVSAARGTQRPDAAALLGAVLALPSEHGFASSRTTRTDRIRLPTGRAVVRKCWTWPTRSDRRRGLFRTTFGAASPAAREHAALGRLQSLPGGSFAPRPLGHLEERRHGILRRCVLLLDEIPAAEDLWTWLLRTRGQPAERRAVLDDLARRTAQMHAAGLSDGDHHPRNVLVAAPGPRTWIVDSPRQRVFRGAVPFRRAVQDLAALDVGLARAATEQERARFLSAYVGRRRGTSRARLAELRRVAGAFRSAITSRRARIEARQARRLHVSAQAD